MDIKERVKEFIEKQGLIREGDRILLGLSGGADSVCLFYVLLELQAELGFMLRAAHVHHGIRAEAAEDVSYVKELCEREGVFCYLFYEDVPLWAREQRLSEEEAGRTLRYRDFEESLEKWRQEEETESACREQGEASFKIATAHHGNDQAETVLFQLFRGCGLSGLRGILPKRENVIRPLLCVSREEIENFLKDKGVLWCEDRTNRLEEYSRNKIRHRILPYAEEEICHGAAAHIAKTADTLREAEEYIKRQVENVYREVAAEREGIVVFDSASLRQEDVFLQKQLLLHGLEQVSAARKNIGAVHVEDIIKLMEKQGNGELFLPGGVRVFKEYRRLLIFWGEGEKAGAIQTGIFAGEKGFLCGEKKPKIRTKRIDLSEERAVGEDFGMENIPAVTERIPQKEYTKWFDYDKIEMPFSIRHRESGDYLTIDGEMNRKNLGRYMIENKIPVSSRDRIWLLADGSHVMWVPGGRISTYYKVTDQTRTVLQIEICAEE